MSRGGLYIILKVMAESLKMVMYQVATSAIEKDMLIE